MPLIILLPALNDMIGDYGTIASSRVSTMLHEGRMGSRPWRNPEIRGLFARIFAVAIITSLVCFAVSIAVSAFSGFEMSAMLALKVLLLTMADVIVLVGTVSTLSVAAGIHFFRKGEDPNNFLIPITTSVADFGNMLILSALVLLMF
jgi:cation transporter-like permease